MVRAQLQELFQVLVLSVFVSDAALVEDPEEVFRLQDVKGLVLGLALYALLVGDLRKELLRGHVLVK